MPLETGWNARLSIQIDGAFAEQHLISAAVVNLRSCTVCQGQFRDTIPKVYHLARLSHYSSPSSLTAKIKPESCGFNVLSKCKPRGGVRLHSSRRREADHAHRDATLITRSQNRSRHSAPVPRFHPSHVLPWVSASSASPSSRCLEKYSGNESQHRFQPDLILIRLLDSAACRPFTISTKGTSFRVVE